MPCDYRVITLVSCFGKLVTIITNERLKKWTLQNNIISDAQFGFKSDYSTVDAIYILESLFNKSEKKKREEKIILLVHRPKMSIRHGIQKWTLGCLMNQGRIKGEGWSTTN